MAYFSYDIEAMKLQHAQAVEELMWAHALFNPNCIPSALQFDGTLSHVIRLSDGRFCKVVTSIDTGDTEVSQWECVHA